MRGSADILMWIYFCRNAVGRIDSGPVLRFFLYLEGFSQSNSMTSNFASRTRLAYFGVFVQRMTLTQQSEAWFSDKHTAIFVTLRGRYYTSHGQHARDLDDDSFPRNILLALTSLVSR